MPTHKLPMSSLVDLLVRKPLARLEVLLRKRRIQYTQPPYLAGRGRVVALDVGFGFAVGSLEGEGSCGLINGQPLIRRHPLVLSRSDRSQARRLEHVSSCTHLLLVVQALVVVLKHRLAFHLARVVFRVCVCDVAGEDFLPEGEAAGGAWYMQSVCALSCLLWTARVRPEGSVGVGLVEMCGRAS
jgi:hypothetical protein